MRFRSLFLFMALLASPLLAQARPSRQVTGGTLVSGSDPAATFVVGDPFRYVGGQSIDLFKVAGAEQHFFVDAAPDRSIERFYWLQFEHYYPSNSRTYDYSQIRQTPVPLGRMEFMGDVRATAAYFTMDTRAGSDSKAAADYLRALGFKVDGAFVTLRLFHLPDSTKRRELMIIYGERLSDGTSVAEAKSQVSGHAQAHIKVP